MANNNISNRDNWFSSKDLTNILKDKSALIEQYIRYMLVRTQMMFEYKNLPNELPSREIELIVQTCRYVIWKKVDDKLYVFYGGVGGIPNEYYLPTQAIVVNPYLKFNQIMEIDEQCVLMWNDDLHIGLMPMFSKYASLLAETDISLRYADVNSRILSLISADNDTAYESAKEMLKKIDDGEELGIIASDGLFEGIKTNDYSNKSTNNIKDLIELHQYLKASWFNELGIQSNFNMKRESINEQEAGMNEDALLPLIDNMLRCRKQAVEKVNKMYGTNIEVELSSSWKKVRNDIVNKTILESEKTLTNESGGDDGNEVN